MEKTYYATEQDIAYDCDAEQFFKDWQCQYNINYKLISENGPAGGNPLYIIYSEDKTELLKFIQEINNYDLEDMLEADDWLNETPDINMYVFETYYINQ